MTSPTWKITHDPAAPGKAWLIRYDRNDRPRKHGKPFPGQWVVFDANNLPPGAPYRQELTVFSANMVEPCFEWIKERRNGRT